MNHDKTAHIEPSEHSTRQVDDFLDEVQDRVDDAPGAGSPATKPNKALRPDGKPATETPENPRL